MPSRFFDPLARVPASKKWQQSAIFCSILIISTPCRRPPPPRLVDILVSGPLLTFSAANVGKIQIILHRKEGCDNYIVYERKKA